MAPPYLQGLFQHSHTDVTGHHGCNPKHLYVFQVETNHQRQLLYFRETSHS